MRIELKILNKGFYNEESNGMLLNPLPSYATPGSAAVDLVCTQDVVVYPGETKMIPTGLAICIGSADVAGLILPRSGLGTKGLILANTIGLIDADYQGELKISAWNRNKVDDEGYDTSYGRKSRNKIKLKAGDRIAQLMFIPVIKTQFEVVEEFSTITSRGQGGFGSTGG